MRILAKNVFQHKINMLALLSFLAITGITFFKNALELEDAEQAYYSQWLRFGYDDQPPLYTWIQFGVNSVLGVSKLSFSILRGVIFSSIILVLYHFAKNWLADEKKAALAVLSLVLVPVFMDFTFRRLSHTSLLCLSIVVSYYWIQRLMGHKSLYDYALFGIIMGIGILSKYNYVLFLGALALASFFDRRLRGIVFHRYSLVAMVLAALLIAPHFYWLLGPDSHILELRESMRSKMENVRKNTLLATVPFFLILINIMRLVAPFLFIGLIAKVSGKIRCIRNEAGWFMKLFWSQLFVFVLFFTVLNVHKVEQRWLLPLLLPFTVLWVKKMAFGQILKWIQYGYLLFLTIIAIQITRTPIEKIFGIPSSVHFGFGPISSKLHEKYNKKKWILPNVTYGGNIRLLNPGREILSSDDFSLPKGKLQESNAVEVVMPRQSLNGRTPLDSIVHFGKERQNLYFVH